VTVLAFVISAQIEIQIAEGLRPNIVWQLLAFVVITAAEVMVSITCLEFSYTQAPRALKSVVMALFLLSVSLGNAFTSFVNVFIQNDDGSLILEGAAYYWFFAGVMLAASVLFIWVAQRYRGKTYLQG
jgi:POT family proton-dependent oligopeptide transporter